MTSYPSFVDLDILPRTMYVADEKLMGNVTEVVSPADDLFPHCVKHFIFYFPKANNINILSLPAYQLTVTDDKFVILNGLIPFEPPHPPESFAVDTFATIA